MAPPGAMAEVPADRPGTGRGTRTGCLALAAILAVAVILGAVLAAKAYAQPDLGPAPQGPLDGGSQADIARRLAEELVVEMARESHAHVFVTEQDLTELAREHNPDPQRYRDPHVRLRDGELVVDAVSSLGPTTVTVVGYVTVAVVTAADGTPDLSTQLDRVAVGTLGIPGWIRTMVDPRLDRAIALSSLLAGSPALAAVRLTIECAAVTSAGLELGFHRPGTRADAASCVSG